MDAELNKKVYIMRGLPGSGKSTWTKENAPGAVVCSADAYFERSGQYKFEPSKIGQAHIACQTKFAKAITSNAQLVVVDNTNTTARELRHYVELAQNAGYMVEIVEFPIDIELSVARNVHGVPRASIERMANRMQPVQFEGVTITKVGPVVQSLLKPEEEPNE